MPNTMQATTAKPTASSTRIVTGRIQAIVNGEKIATPVHPELQREEIVLNIDNFNLF